MSLLKIYLEGFKFKKESPRACTRDSLGGLDIRVIVAFNEDDMLIIHGNACL